jgi:hypothetical protein
MTDHPEPTREPGARVDLAERLEGMAEWHDSEEALAPLLREAASALRSDPTPDRVAGDGLDCPDCGHPWTDHDLADNRDDKGRVLTDTAPLIEVCTAGSGKELGPDDHPLRAACGCIRTYWPDPPYSTPDRVAEGPRRYSNPNEPNCLCDWTTMIRTGAVAADEPEWTLIGPHDSCPVHAPSGVAEGARVDLAEVLRTVLQDATRRESGPGYIIPAVTIEEIKAALARASDPTPDRVAAAEDGASLIAAERRRQVESEGWTPGHDDHHEDGELALAAGAYIGDGFEPDEDAWPWINTPIKLGRPRIEELAKAGALIAAEIERLLRLETAPSETRDDLAAHDDLSGRLAAREDGNEWALREAARATQEPEEADG